MLEILFFVTEILILWVTLLIKYLAPSDISCWQHMFQVEDSEMDERTDKNHADRLWTNGDIDGQNPERLTIGRILKCRDRKREMNDWTQQQRGKLNNRQMN